jgi:hypothetical protein
MNKINTLVRETKSIIYITNPIIYELGIETTKLLSTKQKELHNIRWNYGESNIDTEYSQLACNCCEKSWIYIQNKYPEYENVHIKCNIPDINITFIYPTNTTTSHKIELKSSKNTKMPGSTIKNLDINQILIYCLRPIHPKIQSKQKNNTNNYTNRTENITNTNNYTNNNIYQFKCSQYFSAMGDNNIELFQDRTPRPIINFDKMNTINNIKPYVKKNKNDWIDHYARCSLKRIDSTSTCKYSWQDDMIQTIKNLIINDYIRNTTTEEFNQQKISIKNTL